jgi:tetratricopeptide (TPR) repeat protein
VRGVVWQLTAAVDQRAVYAALEAHFQPMVTPEWRQVETLADLTPAIERYHTLVGLGRYDDAFVFFYDRLNDATFYRLAAHRERIAWLEGLFPDGVTSLPALTSGGHQSSALNALALSYEFSGQPGRSVALLRAAREIDERLGDARNRQARLSNLGDTLREIGAFREAVGALLQALVLNRELEDEFWEGVSLQFLGRVLGSNGAHASGHVAFDRSRHLFAEGSHPQSEGVAGAFQAQLALWAGDLVKAGTWAERARELAAVQRVEQDFIGATLLQGRVALRAGDFSRADERPHHALTRTRAVNVVEVELQALTGCGKGEISADILRIIGAA